MYVSDHVKHKDNKTMPLYVPKLNLLYKKNVNNYSISLQLT